MFSEILGLLQSVYMGDDPAPGFFFGISQNCDKIGPFR